jgi:hypothetical protein
MIKKVMDNRLVGNRRQIRALIVDRAFLQHESRLLERSNTAFTTGHQKTLEALLELVMKFILRWLNLSFCINKR